MTMLLVSTFYYQGVDGMFRLLESNLWVSQIKKWLDDTCGSHNDVTSVGWAFERLLVKVVYV